MLRWGSMKRFACCAGLLFLASACHQQIQRPAQPDTSGARSGVPGQAGTATVLDDVNTADTVEDSAYAVPGEDLAQQAGKTTLGKPAPAATMKTIDGQTIDLAKVYGKRPVYIKFWATWCVPCRQQMPAFQKVYETMGDKMQLIAIDIGLNDDEASIRAFRKKFGLTMPIVLDDGRLGALFNLRVTPQHVLIGRNVRIDYVGHADNAELEQAIQKAVAEPPPAGGAAVATNVAAAQVVGAGEMLPAISVKTTAGATVPLKARPGRVLAVELFSSWCEWYLKTSRPGASRACTRTRLAIAEMARQDNGIDWLGIAGGPWATASDLHDYQTKHAVQIPLALDASNAVFRLFGVRDVPTIALIDSSGRLIKLIGPLDGDLTAVVRAAQLSSKHAGRS